MNCDRARELVPLDVYGDLSTSEQAELTAHLGDCADCARDREELTAVRRAMMSAAVPSVAVDIARIADESLASQRRAVRRWKRAAGAVGALAAALLLAVLLRPEIEIGNGQFVVRWSRPPRTEPPVELVRSPQPIRDAEMEQRVQILSDLIVSLRADIESTDHSRQEQLERVVAALDLLRVQSQQRWNETRVDVIALYRAQFGKKDQGEQ